MEKKSEICIRTRSLQFISLPFYFPFGFPHVKVNILSLLFSKMHRLFVFGLDVQLSIQECYIICTGEMLFANRMANSCNYNCISFVYLFGVVSFDFIYVVFSYHFGEDHYNIYTINICCSVLAQRLIFILAVMFFFFMLCIWRHVRFGVMFIHTKT